MRTYRYVIDNGSPTHLAHMINGEDRVKHLALATMPLTEGGEDSFSEESLVTSSSCNQHAEKYKMQNQVRHKTIRLIP